MKKKLLVMLLSALMLFTFMPLGVFAGSGDADGVRPITYQYSSHVSGEYSNTCYYSDSYFKHSAKVFDLSLATMSFALAQSAFKAYSSYSFGTPEFYTDQVKYVKDLMENIGVALEDIKWNADYETRGERDTYGVIVGSKKIGDETLIIVTGRGSYYEAEWASNFTIGKVGDHKGFNDAKKIAKSFLANYIKEKGITGKVKFWLSGYSRAGACTNLLAAALDRHEIGGKIKYSNKDIYAYTFESPACASVTSLPKLYMYSNIFNLVNPNDPVPYFAPASLGFARYGIDKKFPVSKVYEDKMIEKYNTCGEAWRAPYEVNANQGAFLARLIPSASKSVFKSRANYVNNYQDIARDIFAYIESSPAGTSQALEDYLGKELLRNEEVLKKLLSTDETKAYKKIADILNKSLRYAGCHYKEVKYTANEVKLVAELVKYSLAHLNDMTTLVENMNSIRSGHYPTITFGFLTSWDKNYGGDGRTHFIR